MKFKVQHVVKNVSLQDYERLYFDEAFNAALCAHVKLDRELVELERAGDRLVRAVKVAPDREIPAPAAKVFGGSRIEYTEHLEYTFGQYKGVWRTVPSLLTDKIDSRGTFGFEAVADGVRRTVEGEIKVKILGIGGIAERFIVADVEKSYDNAYAFTQSWIDGGGMQKSA